MSLTFDFKVRGNAFNRTSILSRSIGKGITKTLKQYGEKSKSETRRRIAVGKTDPNNVRWAPWAYSTLLHRINKGNAGLGLLYDTGALWRSIQYQVKGKTLHLGSSEEYAKYLQHGTRNMPARPIVSFNNRKTKNEVKKLLKKNLGFK